MTTLLSEIRAFTEGCHSELEAKFDIFNTIRNEDEYLVLLFKLQAFYTQAEHLLGKWSNEFNALGLVYEKRKKLDLILSDLRHFGRLEVATQAPTVVLPAIENFPQAVGSLYVLEGSTLGGQFISKYLKAVLKLSDNQAGISFYQSYGPSTGQMWKQFCEFLDRYSESLKEAGKDRQYVLDSAKSTFICIGQSLC
jgi:heme oxygenase